MSQKLFKPVAGVAVDFIIGVHGDDELLDYLRDGWRKTNVILFTCHAVLPQWTDE